LTITTTHWLSDDIFLLVGSVSTSHRVYACFGWTKRYFSTLMDVDMDATGKVLVSPELRAPPRESPKHGAFGYMDGVWCGMVQYCG
jgi:hypothetical protein